MNKKEQYKQYILDYMNSVFSSTEWLYDKQYYNKDYQYSRISASLSNSGDFDSDFFREVFDEVYAEQNGWKGYTYGVSGGNANQRYLDYIEQYKDNPALYEKLLENPYQDYTDLDFTFGNATGKLFGFHTKYDDQVQKRQSDAIAWADDIIKEYDKNELNSPLSQSSKMRLAGQNPDLLGTDAVAEMGAGSPLQPSDITSVESPIFQAASTVFDVVGTLATIGLGSANFLVNLKSAKSLIGLQGSQSALLDAQKTLTDKNLNLVQSQIESNEVNTLGTLEKVVTDWTLNNLTGDDYDNYVKVKRDEYAKMAVAKGLIKSVDEYIPTPEEEIDLSVAGVAPALSMSDEVIAEKLTGFSPNTIARVKGAYKRINPRSAYFQSRLAEWRKNKTSANVDLARLMADPRYSDNIGVMSVLYQPTQKMLKNAFDAEITYKQKSAQYQKELIDAIYKISEQQGELTPEQLAELSLPELQAYQSKMQSLALTKQSSYDKMYYGYFADMFQVAEDIRFSNADPAQFEQFMSNWYSVIVPLIKNFSTNSGSVNGNLGANFNVGVGAYYNRSHNTSESTSENKNIDIAKVLQLLGVFGE